MPIYAAMTDTGKWISQAKHIHSSQIGNRSFGYRLLLALKWLKRHQLPAPQARSLIDYVSAFYVYIRADCDDASSGFGIWAKTVREQLCIAIVP